MQAIAVAHIGCGIHLDPHELARGVVFAADQRIAADEVIGLGFKRHGKANASFKRVGFIGEIVAGKDQTGFDAHHIQAKQAHGANAQISTCGHHRIINRNGVLGVAEDFIAQLARVARARHHQRRAVKAVQTRDRVAEPSQLFHRGLGRRCPDDALHNLAAVGALHRQIVQLVGARAHHDL